MGKEPTHYEKNRSHRHRGLYLICYEGGFDGVPQAARSRGPWHGGRGLVANLKPDVRAALARDGYLLYEGEEALWSPEK